MALEPIDYTTHSREIDAEYLKIVRGSDPDTTWLIISPNAKKNTNLSLPVPPFTISCNRLMKPRSSTDWHVCPHQGQTLRRLLSLVGVLILRHWRRGPLSPPILLQLLIICSRVTTFKLPPETRTILTKMNCWWKSVTRPVPVILFRLPPSNRKASTPPVKKSFTPSKSPAPVSKKEPVKTPSPAPAAKISSRVNDNNDDDDWNEPELKERDFDQAPWSQINHLTNQLAKSTCKKWLLKKRLRRTHVLFKSQPLLVPRLILVLISLI